MLWVHGTAPRLATPLHVCVGFPGDTPPPSSEAGQPLGASAGQTNWKRLPSLGRVNPGPPATTQSPSIIAAPSQLFLPNKTQTRELRGTSQNTGESHRAPPHYHSQILPYFRIKGQSWGTSASHFCPHFRTSIFILSSCLPPAGFDGKLKGPGFKNLCPA